MARQAQSAAGPDLCQRGLQQVSLANVLTWQSRHDTSLAIGGASVGNTMTRLCEVVSCGMSVSHSGEEVIENLTARERGLMAQVHSVQGTMQEKEKQLAQLGVFAEYCSIHRDYVACLSDALSGMEALKRALFIQWIALTEPSCFTGIRGLDLDWDSQKRVLEVLDAVLRDDRADSELTMMLDWYIRIADWYFEKLNGYPAISRFVGQPLETPLPTPRRTQFEDRGAMGEYWRSLNFVEE
jgi:hypothetical protein